MKILRIKKRKLEIRKTDIPYCKSKLKKVNPRSSKDEKMD